MSTALTTTASAATTTLPASLPASLTMASTALGTTLPATLEPLPATQIALPTTTASPAVPPTGRSMSAVERYVIVIALAVTVVLAGIVLSLSTKK